MRANYPILRSGAKDDVLTRCVEDLRSSRSVVVVAATDDPASIALVASRTHSPVERSRAARFLRPVDGAQHLLGRALVRRVVGDLFGILPEQVPLVAPANEKPRLAGLRLETSISHSGGFVACGFSPIERIGVDVELRRQGRASELNELVDDVFSEAERAFFRALPEWDREETFLSAWRRKEAIVKATGLGLAIAPALVPVLEADGRFASVVAVGETLWCVTELFAPSFPPVAVAWEVIHPL